MRLPRLRVALLVPAIALAPALAYHGGIYPPVGAPTTPGPNVPSTPGNFPKGPVTPGPPRPAGALPATGGVAFAESVSTWWTWWERNRFDYLLPRRVRTELPATGDDLPDKVAHRLASSLAARRDEWLRGRILPRLEANLRHRDHNVRASTLVALAKLDGTSRVPAFRAALKDAHAVVRDAAILSLGASATDDGAALLAKLAADDPEGRAAFGGAGSIPPRTRAMALLGLGVSSARGGPDRVTAAARAALADRGAGRHDIGAGACAALGLARDRAAVPDLLRVAADRGEPTPVRTRALAALASIGDASARPTVASLLAERDLFVRAAAALAFGDLAARGDEEAAARLVAFLQKEEDPDASGFALVSLGRIGGPVARAELVRELARGKESRKAYASLGLALAVRDGEDADARARIRELFRTDRSPDRRGAHAIALALVGESSDPGPLAKVYRDAGSLDLRVEMTEALALHRAEEGRDALVDAVVGAKSALERGQAAFALGFFCDPRDTRPLAAALRANSVTTLTGLYSLGLGIHGSEAAVEELLRLLEAETSAPAAIAAATDGLTVAFEADPIPVLHRVARGSNYLADPAFVLEALEFLL